MTGREYADLVASYIVANFGAARDLHVYREVRLGRTIIGKSRKVDLFVMNKPSGIAMALECKVQESLGTTDEKIPYALADIEAVPVPGYIVYTGAGFSPGVKHMLEASRFAALCLPTNSLARTPETRELDHILALTFRWWDVVVSSKVPHQLP